MIKLTGNTRYTSKNRWFSPSYLVLQVEELHYDRVHWSNFGSHIECDSIPDQTVWRDATIEDLQILLRKENDN